MKKHLEPISIEYNNGYTKISECSFCKSRGLFREFSTLEHCRFCNNDVLVCKEKAIWSHLTKKWYKESEVELMNNDINKIIQEKKLKFKLFSIFFIFLLFLFTLGSFGI